MEEMHSMNEKKWLNSYERERITKTIKLELVPEEITKEYMEKHGSLEADKQLIERANNLHETLDWVVRKIIKGALATLPGDFDKLYQMKIKANEKDATDKDKKAYKKEREKMLMQIEKTITNYKLPGLKSCKNITEAQFLKNGLPDMIKNADDLDAETKVKWLEYLEDINGMPTMLQKFVTTRNTALSRWCPDRVLENFDIFTDNIKIIKDFLQEKDSEEFCDSHPRFEDLQYASFYEFCVTPEQITNYNRYISGYVLPDGTRTEKGYNQYINEINTKNKNDKSFEGIYYRKMKPLKAQILMPKEKQFVIEVLKDDDEVRKLLETLLQNYEMSFFEEIVNVIATMKHNSIIVNGNNLHNISHIHYGDHRKIPNKLQEIEIEKLNEEMQDLKGAKKKAVEKKIDTIGNLVTNKTYSFEELEKVMEDEDITNSYITLLRNDYIAIKTAVNDIMSSDILTTGSLRGYHKDKVIIKSYLDAIVKIRKDINLITKTDDDRIDVVVMNKIDEFMTELAPLTKIYNMIRNYLTSKMDGLVKEDTICFGSPSKFASRWWSGDKFEGNNYSIAKIDEKYYFFCVGYKQKPVNFEIVDENADCEKVKIFNQKTGQDASKHFPAVVFNKDCKKAFEETDAKVYVHTDMHNFEVTREEYEIYKNKLFAVSALADGLSPEKHREYLAKLINLYKRFTTVYDHYKRFIFNFLPTEEYRDIGLFMADANVCMVDPSWVCISKKQFDSLVNTGNIYMFLIKNNNMYRDYPDTTYAKIFFAMMSEENFENHNIRINARPNITYRPACIPYHITHKKGSYLVNKTTKDGKRIPIRDYKLIYNYVNKKEGATISGNAKKLLESGQVVTKIASNDISRNMRYMTDKLFITFSYTKNGNVSDRKYNTISNEVMEELSTEKEYRTISVVRGKKQMMYYTVFDTDHKTILEEGSLNKIGDTDYAELLSTRIAQDEESKNDWNYNTIINDIKEPYIRHCISIICRLAVTYNAVIVIEKVSDGLKNKLFVDNQLYKSFDSKLEARLSDYHYLDKETGEFYGTLTRPLQLTRVDGNSAAWQNGLLFRMPGAYTGNMCLKTGFVNLFDFNAIKSMRSKKQFLQKFDEIKYSPDTNLFYFTFDYSNFKTFRKTDKKKWTVIVGKTVSRQHRITKEEYLDSKVSERLLEELNAGNAFKGNKVLVDNLSLKEADMLFEAFKRTLRQQVVYNPDKIRNDYYSSPVLEEDDITLLPEQVKCRNLAMRLWYHIERNEDDKSDYTEGWLNYALEKKQSE